MENNNKIVSTLINRDATLSTVWSAIQQVVVAASTYFIVEAIREITANHLESGLYYVGAFVASLFLVYIPNALSMIFLEKWRLTSTEQFIRSFISSNKGQTSFGHATNKAAFESWLTHECFTLYDTITNLLYQSLSTLMNSLFNIVIIAVAIDARILTFYILAALVLLASHFLFRKKIAEASLGVQGNRNELTSSMLNAWQNIFVGNDYNFKHWDQNFTNKVKKAKASAVKYNLIKSMISSGTVGLALVVITIGNGIYLWENHNNLSAMAALMITFPRQLQIIQSIFAFFNLFISWSGSFNQLKSLGKIIDFSETKTDTQKYIQFYEIDFLRNQEKRNFGDFSALVDAIYKEQNGRWTLRGRNGSGKSTLLCLLKEKFGEEGFFLPTHYEDLCFSSEFLNESDGNRLAAVFEMISKIENVKFIILDEWDANLDEHNLNQINAAIDRLAKNRIVLESRHRG